MGSYVNGVYVPSVGETGWDGAVSAELTALGRHYIDITQEPYGADRTGAIDSTAAIQAAVDASGWPSSRGYVVCPPGRYKVNGTVTLDGAGASSTKPLALVGFGADWYTETASTSPMLDITNTIVSTTYVTVEGLMFVPNAGTGVYRTAVRLTNTQDTVFHNCKFAGNFATGIEINSLSTYTRISDCAFLFLRRGISFAGSGNLATISGCRFEEGLVGSPLNWIDASNGAAPTDQVTVAHNVFYAPGATLGAIRVANGNDWTISNNVFQLAYAEAISLGANGSSRGHVIAGNTFYHGLQHDIVINGAQRNMIVGNMFDVRDSSVADNTYSAVRVKNTGGFDAGHFNVVANNNSMDTAAKLNFMVELDAGCDYCVVTGNIGRAGIQAAGANNQVANNITA